MSGFLDSFARNQSGATAIECSLVAGLISIVILGAGSTVGSTLSSKFNAFAAALK
jgi:pilus assembly protein Flp/PilA